MHKIKAPPLLAGMTKSPIPESPSYCGNAPAIAIEAIPPPDDPLADATIPARVWSAFIPSDGKRELRRPLAGVERQALEARAAELAPALASYRRPLDDDRVATALATMFGAFHAMRGQGGDALARIHATMDLLATFPAWAIQRACLSIQRDGYQRIEHGVARIERTWPPSDPELVEALRAIVRPYAKALASAKALLCAPVEIAIENTQRPARAEIETKLGRLIGDRLKAEHGVSDEQWAAIPVRRDDLARNRRRASGPTGRTPGNPGRGDNDQQARIEAIHLLDLAPA
jgi:hypothetical protein